MKSVRQSFISTQVLQLWRIVFLTICSSEHAQMQDILLFLYATSRPSSFKDAPNITSLSGEQTVLVNSSVNISCRVDTFPSSTITWYLDNEVVSSSRVNTQSVDRRTQESTVTISSVGTVDSGTYRCEASNILGSTFRTTGLTVESEFFASNIHTCAHAHTHAHTNTQRFN